MKQYPRLLAELFNRPLAITRAKHAAICRVLESHLANPPRADDNPDLDLDDEDENASRRDPMAERIYQQVSDAAIIRVHGILGKHLDLFEMISGGCDLAHVCAALDIASEDRNVRRIFLDFRTPGGSVTGIPECARKIASLSKPSVAFTDSECNSGGIWLASQCQYFYASESARVGSVGVWTAYWDLTKAMEMAGERMQSIQAGKYKLLGASWKPLTPEEETLLQQEVDKIHAQFKDAVNLRREVAAEHLEGQVFDGIDALDAGLIDGLADDLSELL
jgi:signal peptide peptidase SppA